MLCTILPVLYLSMLLLPLGLRKMAAPCQSPEGARSGSAINGYDLTVYFAVLTLGLPRDKDLYLINVYDTT